MAAEAGNEAREVAKLAELVVGGRASSRSELASLTGLPRSTVSRRVEHLLRIGLLVESGDGPSSGGRRPVLITINPAAGVVLSAYLGATHSRIAIADLSGQIEAEQSWKADIGDGPDRVLAGLVDRLLSLLDQHGRSPADVRAIGIGVPGPVEFATGTVVQPPIMPGWDGLAVPAILREHFHAPVLVDNDVNIMALGEYWFRGCHDEQLLFVKVGTGIGCGIITNGLVHRGADGAAGDIGHVRVAGHDDVICVCGNSSCLEAVASGSAIARQLAAEGLDVRYARDVVRLGQAGDPRVVRHVRVAGERIGEVLASMVNFYNPSQIVLGGSVAALRDDLLAGIRGVVYQRAVPLATRRLTIEACASGERAGVLGGAILAAQNALGPEQVARWLRAGTVSRMAR
jgi:predicted NBD/HSP70 family sugar kinase